MDPDGPHIGYVVGEWHTPSLAGRQHRGSAGVGGLNFATPCLWVGFVPAQRPAVYHKPVPVVHTSRGEYDIAWHTCRYETDR